MWHDLSFRKQPHRNSDSLWERQICLTERERKEIAVQNNERKQLTWNSPGDDTVTSATSQPEEGAPDRCQSAADSSPLRTTCTPRVLEVSPGSQYLNIQKNITLSLWPQCRPGCSGSASLTRSVHKSLKLKLKAGWAVELSLSLKSLMASQSCRNLQHRDTSVVYKKL